MFLEIYFFSTNDWIEIVPLTPILRSPKGDFSFIKSKSFIASPFRVGVKVLSVRDLVAGMLLSRQTTWSGQTT